MSDPTAPPIAGWYPDPENEAGDRWWNGSGWSDHRRPRNAAPGWAPVASAPVDRPNPYAGNVPAAAPVPGTAPAAAPTAPPYAYNAAPRASMQNVPAFAGMLTSLIAIMFNWILFGLPGITGAVISIVGLVKANRLAASGVTIGNGRAQAVVGIVVGLAGALLWNLFYIWVFAPFSFS